MTEKGYVLKIILEETKPLIWRTVIVSNQLTLDRLHDVIQIVLGWKNSHLHQFMMGTRCFASNEESVEILEGEEEGRFRLSELLTEPGDHLEYEYDFGDGWLHTIVLEKAEAIPKGHGLQMTCLDGRRACPPEDVGGIPGFEHFCEVMKNSQDPEHEELKQWYGGKFKPRAFDVDDANQELAKYANWTRPRLLP